MSSRQLRRRTIGPGRGQGRALRFVPPEVPRGPNRPPTAAATCSEAHGRPRGGRRTRIGRYRCEVCVRFPSALIGRGGENRGCAYPSSVAASQCC